MGQLETEEMIASQIMRDNDLIYNFPIKKEYIRDPDVRNIIEAIKDINAQGLRYSRHEIARLCPNISKERIRLISKATTYNDNFQEHVKELKEYIRLGKVETIEEIVSNGIDSGKSSGRIIADIELYISSIDSDSTETQIIGIAEVVANALTRLEYKTQNPGLPGISTGFKELDDMFGGFEPGKLYYISARPSEGKTALMLNMFKQVMKDDISAGIISIESTTREVGSRLLSIVSQLYVNDVLRGENIKDVPEVRKRMGEICTQFGPFYHEPHATIDDVEVIISRMRAKHDVKVIFIDYTQLITATNRGKRHEQVAAISRRIKAAALKNDVAIVSLSQLKRDVDGRKAGLGDNAESSSFEKDADVMMALWHRTNDSGYEESSIEVLKARDGSTGSCKVNFRRAQLIFEDLS